MQHIAQHSQTLGRCPNNKLGFFASGFLALMPKELVWAAAWAGPNESRCSLLLPLPHPIRFVSVRGYPWCVYNQTEPEPWDL